MRSSTESWRSLAVPVDAPIAHAPGVDADRVLLIGNGIAVGYGVLSHDLGLAGHLARRLTALTGRGTTVDVQAGRDVTAPRVLASLSKSLMGNVDTIVSTLGGTEAVALRSSASWRDDMEKLFAAIHVLAPAVRINCVGIPLSSVMVHMPRLYGLVVEAQIVRLNAITKEVCERHANAVFVPFEPQRSRVVDHIGRESYRGWANLIAGPIADELDAHTHAAHAPEDEGARIAALDHMNLTQGARDDDVERLVATARDLFGASGSGLNIIDRTRQWVLAAAGMSRDDIPRSESICTQTITSSDVLVIEDTHLDALYSERSWAHGANPIRFYAGYPLEAPDGHHIGALCVVDNVPRLFTAKDRVLLRELAMQVQSLLWDKHGALSR